MGAGLALYLGTGLSDALVCLHDRSYDRRGILGGIVGILKAYLNVNEVIAGIMLNWISLYGCEHAADQCKGIQHHLYYGTEGLTHLGP